MKLECRLPVQNICNFYLVVYRDKVTGELSRIEAYNYDQWGGTGNSSSDIDSYKYGYDAEIIDVVDLLKGEDK